MLSPPDSGSIKPVLKDEPSTLELPESLYAPPERHATLAAHERVESSYCYMPDDTSDEEHYSRPGKVSLTAAGAAKRPHREQVSTRPAHKAAAKARPTRKTTHSVIERRRREKINQALHRLTELVPQCAELRKAQKDTRIGVQGLHKLTILEATVAYLETLTAGAAPTRAPSTWMSDNEQDAQRQVALNLLQLRKS